jgi:hypothetical protein
MRPVHPANIQILGDSFEQDLVDQVRRIEGVAEAEGVRTARLRLKAGEEWITIQVKAIPEVEETPSTRSVWSKAPGLHSLARSPSSVINCRTRAPG